jgi:acyl carrier protein
MRYEAAAFPPATEPPSIRSIVETAITQTAAENNKVLPPLSDDLCLLESELDSLCLAVMVARLEDSLGLDPFSANEDITFPVTIGDLIKLYEEAK